MKILKLKFYKYFNNLLIINNNILISIKNNLIYKYKLYNLLIINGCILNFQ